jgi:hypothetical protein
MQTYRNPPWSLVIIAIGLTLMAVIGVSIAIDPGDAGQSGTAPGYIACGSVVAAGCILLIVGQFASRLVVTEQGLTWRYFLRTKSIAWADVQDVLTVPASAAGRYYSPGVKAGGRLIRINCVIGQRRYTESIVAAIREARAAAQHCP